MRLHAERRCNCRHRQAQEQCLQQATGNTCHFLSPSHAAAYRDIPRPREEPVAPAQPVSVRTISGTSAASYERIIQASAARSALISNDLLNISASSYIAAGQTGPSKFTSPGCPARPSGTGRPRTPLGRSPGAATLACCKDTGFEGRSRLALDFFPWSQGTDLVSEPVQIDMVTDYDVPVRVAYEIVFAQDCPLRVIASLHNAHGSAALGEQ